MKKIDLVKSILSLPGNIYYQGAHFSLTFFKNGDELRLSYDLNYVDKDSIFYNEEECKYGFWINPFLGEGNYPCTFLYLVENIVDSDSLLEAIQLTNKFLLYNKII